MVNNETGLKFKTNNHVDLANKIQEFDKIKNEEFNKNARIAYLVNFSHNKNVQSLINIYKEVIEKK